MSVNINLVKELREKSGAGMMDCKKALEQANGNMDDAIDWLRKKGLSIASKKSSRTTSEGLVATNVLNGVGTIVEINSETDFVSRNDEFQDFVNNVSIASLNVESINELMKCNYNDTSKLIEDILNDKIAKIGENLIIRRMKKIFIKEGLIVQYIHNRISDNLGRIGVLIALESKADNSILDDLGKKLAMHIAALSPMSIDIENLDPNIIDREKQVLIDQAKSSGKPPEIIEKMIEGRIKKFYEEVVLLEQTFVMDGENKVKDIIQNVVKDCGQEIEIKDYVHFVLGEGIKKDNKDFASEVAAQLS